MTYSTCYSSGVNWFGKFILILLILVMVAIGLSAFQMQNSNYHTLYGQSVIVAESYTLSEHAAQRHSEKAEKVVQCLNQKGSVLNLFNPITGRTAHVCEIEANKFGVLITEGEQKCVTCFIKERMKQLEKVIQYLANVGYH
jgi:hypothetical protein